MFPSSDPDSDPRALFAAEIPLQAKMSETLRAFERFGPVKRLRFFHPKSGPHIGRAFVDYFEPSSGSACLSHSEWQVRDIPSTAEPNEILIRGSSIDVMLQKSKYEYLDLMSHPNRRNLHLLTEGRLTDEMAFALTEDDFLRRKRIWQFKEAELRDVNKRLSDIRLTVYNLPIGCDTGTIRRAFSAAPSNYARGHPSDPITAEIMSHEVRITSIRKIEYSDDTAVVEFARHEHALAALREIDNSAKYFGGIRPIVEFRVEPMYTPRNRVKTDDRVRMHRFVDPPMVLPDEDIPIWVMV
jgi:RNA recognition motif-containing protein